MTTIKTDKQIKDEYLISSVDSEQPQYVSLQEYEALKLEAGDMSQEKERDIIKRDERIFELETENEALQNLLLERVSASNDTIKELMARNKAIDAILQRWAEISPALMTMNNLSQLVAFGVPELEQLIAATNAALWE